MFIPPYKCEEKSNFRRIKIGGNGTKLCPPVFPSELCSNCPHGRDGELENLEHPNDTETEDWTTGPNCFVKEPCAE